MTTDHAHTCAWQVPIEPLADPYLCRHCRQDFPVPSMARHHEITHHADLESDDE